MHFDDVKGHKVAPSLGSMASQHFMAANGQVVENEGQTDVRLATEDENTLVSCFQMAKVSRPLYSAPQMTDKGCTVIFTKGVGKVLKGKGRVMAEREVASFKRKGGLYLARMKVNRPDSGFTRQGTR